MSIVNILHLSDLHFGVQDANYGSKDMANLHQRAIDELCGALRRIPEEYPDWCPDIIAVTGDVAWAAKEDDYKQAAEFIQRLMDMFHLLPEDVILCPGNHDVDLGVSMYTFPVKTQKESEKHLSVKGIAYRSAPFANFSKFAENLGIPPLENSVGDMSVRYLYGCRDIRNIRFAVFNTAWNVRKREPDEKESLWIGSLLTNDVLRQPQNPKNDLFVSLFHHPFGKLDDSECRSYGQKLVVKQDILAVSDVILNGHIHGEICEATFTENKAHTFISSTAFDKDSVPKGCQIIQIDRSRRCYSTKVVFCGPRQKWEIEDLETDVPLDKVTARPNFAPAETAVQLPPETVGWWLPRNWVPLEGPLPIDDGASLCLLTFLLSRTDPYVVVLASDAEIRLTGALQEESRRLKELADAEETVTYTPRNWSVYREGSSFGERPGIVVSLPALEASQLGAALDGYESLRGQAPEAAVVYCVWSDSLKAAAESAQMFASKLRKQVSNVDVLALSVRRSFCTPDAKHREEAIRRVRALDGSHMPFMEEVDALLRIRDEEPELWPYILRCHAASREGKNRILSFVAASHRQSDVDEWLQAVKLSWFQDQEAELNPFSGLLFRDDARRLAWGIYRKTCSERNEEAREGWERILNAQLAAAPSVKDFRSLLNGQELESSDAISPEDTACWARNASCGEFERLLPELLKQGLTVYWAALLASPYGRPYVLREFSLSDKMQMILNADEGSTGDPHWQEQLSSLRQVSRPC